MANNSMTQIREFLSTPEKPVSMAEFSEFWKSLSEDEKNEYKNADLTA